MAMDLKKQGHKPLLWQDLALKVGTRFSGLGSCEEALKIMEPHVSAKFEVCYACDHDADSFQFYKKRFMKGAAASKHHYFNDVTDLVKLNADLSQKSFGEKKAEVEKADMASQAPCKIHGKKCQIPWTDMDVSGSVCKDYSAQGFRAGCEGKYALSMLTHFQELRKRQVPIRISENVVSAEGQASIASAMPDCEVHYVITMPEDCGTACVRRDRGWLVGVSAPYRFIRDPNITYAHLASILAASQVPQAELWFDDEKGQETEMKSASSRLRPSDMLLGCEKLNLYGEEGKHGGYKEVFENMGLSLDDDRAVCVLSQHPVKHPTTGSGLHGLATFDKSCPAYVPPDLQAMPAPGTLEPDEEEMVWCAVLTRVYYIFRMRYCKV
eukprot:Skav210805  [mRNA]  locus=scaffold2924:4832:6600:- [translate_table: standard]